MSSLTETPIEDGNDDNNDGLSDNESDCERSCSDEEDCHASFSRLDCARAESSSRMNESNNNGLMRMMLHPK